MENLEPIETEPSSHGEFYETDSYVILITREKASSAIPSSFTTSAASVSSTAPDATAVSLIQDIHLWLGQKTGVEEQGAASIMAVELDNIVGGQAALHRQVQHHEPPSFAAAFSNQLTYLSGGFKSCSY